MNLFLGCHVQITSGRGSIMSPGYSIGSKYPNSLNCSWNITSPRSQHIKMVFNTNSKLETGDVLKV